MGINLIRRLGIAILFCGIAFKGFSENKTNKEANNFTIVDFKLEMDENSNGLVVYTLDSNAHIDSTISGVFPFEINQIIQNLQFSNGRAVYPNAIKSKQFLFLQKDNPNASKFYYVIHGEIFHKIIQIPLWLLWFIPLIMLILAYLFRKIIILIFLLLFFGFFYFGGMDFSAMMNVLKEGFMSIFQ